MCSDLPGHWVNVWNGGFLNSRSLPDNDYLVAPWSVVHGCDW